MLIVSGQHMSIPEKQRFTELFPQRYPERRNLQKQWHLPQQPADRRIRFPGKSRRCQRIPGLPQNQRKNWERLAEVKSNVTSYQDSKVQGITTYTYSVRAYRIVDGKKVFGDIRQVTIFCPILQHRRYPV